MRTQIQICLLIVFLMLPGCTGNRSSGFGGGGTETVGIIYNSKGAPAAEAKILFVPTDFVPKGYAEKGKPDSVYANSKGEFFFDHLNDGEYNLFYEKAGEFAFREAVTITNEKVDTIIVDTLQTPGSVSGVVRLRPEHNSQKVYILIMGSNRFYTPQDSTGGFTLDNLAAGTYAVRFVPREDNYRELDTFITITSGVHETLGDTIRIPYEGLLPPENVSLAYNSELQKVTLSWDSVSSPRLKSYMVKREENIKGGNVKYFPTTETVFEDCTDGKEVVQGREYLYSIRAIDEHGVGGKAAFSKPLIFSSVFTEETPVQITDAHQGFFGDIECIDKNRYLLSSNGEKRVHVVDENTQQILYDIDLTDRGFPYDLEYMSDSTVMIATDRGIYNFTVSGDSLHFFPIVTNSIETKHARFLYYTDRQSELAEFKSLKVLDMEYGDILPIMEDRYRTIKCIKIIDDDVLVIFSYEGEIHIERSPLRHYNPKRLFTSEEKSGAIDIDAYDEGLSFLMAGEVHTINWEGVYLRKLYVNKNALALGWCSPELFTLWGQQGTLQTFRKKIALSNNYINNQRRTRICN